MIGIPLGLLRIVDKSPIVGGGDPLIVKSPCLDDVMTSE